MRRRVDACGIEVGPLPGCGHLPARGAFAAMRMTDVSRETSLAIHRVGTPRDSYERPLCVAEGVAGVSLRGGRGDFGAHRVLLVVHWVCSAFRGRRRPGDSAALLGAAHV